MAHDHYLVPLAKISGPRSPIADSNVEENEPGRLESWRHQAQQLQTEALVFYFVFKHPRVTWFARWVAACIAAYLLSPLQLIPSYIPIIGFLDDLLVLFLGVKLLRRIIPKDVLADCRQRAEVVETQGKEEIRPVAATVGLVAIIFLWLLAAVIASALIMKYIHHYLRLT
jgi:uncharacterized membrane protein YkvA (DUF1232 family)